MSEPGFQRARYYRVSAKDWPIEKYMLCDSARDAAEEFAALFDLGDLFDRVEITVSLSDARGNWRSQEFTVRTTHMRVYEAVEVKELSEPEPEEILEFEEMGEIRDVELDDAVAGRSVDECPPVDEPLLGPALAAAELDEVDEPTVLKLVAAADEAELPPDDEPDDNSSSGLRRLAGIASRGYGTLIKGLFGRRRGRAA
ncbi:hypothetical protein [Nannocystis radixulma]|uniref:Uncharacterized protein n=1 Tax=Nannocystis radixulma TaxID=2995305 RepID=A0ABT5B6N9_9BACT|nr:hypothetical protein [Nannocystis radixulma]MDC0669774.1 hypothetical protein [Nannocystis radixulma]